MPIEKGCTHCGSDQHNTTECPMRDAAPAGEREAFEIWARKPDNGTGKLDLRLCDIGLYYRRETGTAWDGFQAGAAWQRGQSAGVPAGYALVPFHPTPEMVKAAEEAHMPFGDMDIALRMAILAAAPAQPAVQDHGECFAVDAARAALLASHGRGEA